MQDFHNILFVSNGVADETEAIKQSLSLARNNNARLKALIVSPEFPVTMVDYKENYEGSLKKQLHNSIQAIRDKLHVSDAEIPVQIELISGDRPADQIIRYVLRHAHDLIVKEAELKEDHKGFKAVDMELLRKSACPVWLCRPIKHHRSEINVAVAIDPEGMAPESKDLALQLLALSRHLADTCNGELHIISCWDLAMEKSLRHNPWIKVEEDEIEKSVKDAQNLHHKALENLLSQSGISGKIKVHHVKGAADQMIPKIIDDKKIDILIMGTVARTGIPGVIFGNTAENVVQKVGCSLIALKPNGFISPVKAY